MLQQLKHQSTGGQLLLINVQMLIADLEVFTGELNDRLEKYIDLQNRLLKQAITDNNNNNNNIIMMSDQPFVF